MKHFTAATIAVALSVALVGCGSGNKSDNKTPTSTSTSTSTSTTTTTTSATRGAHANKTIADYIVENKITETYPPRRSRSHHRFASAPGLADRTEQPHVLRRHRSNAARGSHQSAHDRGDRLEAHR